MTDIVTRPHKRPAAARHMPQPHRPFNAWSSEDALDKHEIAELTPGTICQMTHNELVRVIQAAGLPLLRKDILGRLDLYNRESLEQMVFMARRCCRNQGY